MPTNPNIFHEYDLATDRVVVAREEAELIKDWPLVALCDRAISGVIPWWVWGRLDAAQREELGHMSRTAAEDSLMSRGYRRARTRARSITDQVPTTSRTTTARLAERLEETAIRALVDSGKKEK